MGKSFKQLSRRWVLTGYCLPGFFLTAVAGHFRIQVIDQVPLLLETGYYSSKSGPGNTIYILDDTISISGISLLSRLQADMVHYINQPVPLSRTVEYRVIMNADSGLWRKLPSATGNNGTVVLARLSVPAAASILLQFRFYGEQNMLQTTRIERPSWKPELIAYFQDVQADTFHASPGREAYLAALLASGKQLPASGSMTMAPGMPAVLLFKKPGLHNDTCIEYRYNNINSKNKSDWVLSDVLLKLPAMEGNAVYLLDVRYPHSPDIQSFFLQTSPYWYQQKSFRIIGWSFACLLVVGISLFISRHRVRKIRQQRNEVQTQLQLMQNQLNPHFVYNAIGSIMGLISAGESQRAKEYLEVFSGMMQHIMDKSNEPSISLAEDMDQMEQYMRMEQLRFQFFYEVQIDPSLDLSRIELPPQLLQPVIENAVRHGAAGLGANGRVLLQIYAEGYDLCINVMNNALPGKQIRQQGKGIGIRFTKGQMAKLQQLYKGQRISFDMKITPYQAEANFFFQNWLNPALQ